MSLMLLFTKFLYSISNPYRHCRGHAVGPSRADATLAAAKKDATSTIALREHHMKIIENARAADARNECEVGKILE